MKRIILALMLAAMSAMLVVGLSALVLSPASAQTRPAPPAPDLMASPGNPGWSVDARSGCWIWNPNPQPGEVVTWTAGCGSDGRASGSGNLEWRHDGKVERYSGEYRDGKRHGRGVHTWVDGGRYEGEFRDGKQHGRGVRTWNGERYEGEYRDDKQHGRGVYTWADGDRYEGEYRDGRPDGFGEARINGTRYVGRWAGGCFRDGNQRGAIGRPLSECP